jgi:YidC/Oxa1 family membrane protein insertase
MDKNTITGLILMMLLFMGFSFYAQQQQKKAEAIQKEKLATAKKDSIINAAKNPIQEGTVSTAIKNDTNVTPIVIQPEKLMVVENKDCKFVFTSLGGQLKSVTLKNYVTHDKKPLALFENLSQGITVEIPTATGKMATSKAAFAELPEQADGDKKVVAYELTLPGGGKYRHKYIIPKQGYLIDFSIVTDNTQKDFGTVKSLKLEWTQRMPSLENNIYEEQMYADVYYSNDKRQVEDLSTRKDVTETTESEMKWVSFKQKFFNTTLIAEKALPSGAKVGIAADKDKKTFVKDALVLVDIPLENSNSSQVNFQMYMGPNHFKTLKKLDVGLQGIIPLGWSIFGWVNKFMIIPVFNFLSKFMSNYGLIILILTLIIKVVLSPLTHKQLVSSAKMQLLKPELDELKKKFPDKQVFGAKQMELFREAGVNPAGGCLPMLLQMPILLAMYRFFPSSIELRQQPFLWATDLSHYDDFLKLPYSIPLLGEHISIFAVLMAITSVFYSKISMQGQVQDEDSIMGQQMKIMQYVMPVMMLFMFNKFAAALSYYYLLFNVISIAQTYIFKKFFINHDDIIAEMKVNKLKPKKKGIFQEKMEQMMKEQESMRKNQQGKK